MKRLLIWIGIIALGVILGFIIALLIGPKQPLLITAGVIFILLEAGLIYIGISRKRKSPDKKIKTPFILKFGYVTLAMFALIMFVQNGVVGNLPLKYNAGVEAFEADDWDKAIRQFESVITTDPEFKDAEDLLEVARTKKKEAEALEIANIEKMKSAQAKIKAEKAKVPEPDIQEEMGKIETAIESSVDKKTRGYSIIEKSTISNTKCSLEIRLSSRLSKAELSTLANELKKSHGQGFERVFIAYYLPDMEVGSGAWATSHFNPDMEVKILGLTAKQAEESASSSQHPGEELIGIWIDEVPYMANTTKLYRFENKIWIFITFHLDGSTYSREMTESSTPRGIRYEERGGNRHGEYYLLDNTGTLNIYGPDGFDRSMKKKKSPTAHKWSPSEE